MGEREFLEQARETELEGGGLDLGGLEEGGLEERMRKVDVETMIMKGREAEKLKFFRFEETGEEEVFFVV